MNGANFGLSFLFKSDDKQKITESWLKLSCTKSQNKKSWQTKTENKTSKQKICTWNEIENYFSWKKKRHESNVKVKRNVRKTSENCVKRFLHFDEVCWPLQMFSFVEVALNLLRILWVSCSSFMLCQNHAPLPWLIFLPCSVRII